MRLNRRVSVCVVPAPAPVSGAVRGARYRDRHRRSTAILVCVGRGSGLHNTQRLRYQRNWLFVGNARSANAGALLFSLVQTCLINDIKPVLYFNDLLSHAQQIRRHVLNAEQLLPQNINRSLLG